MGIVNFLNSPQIVAKFQKICGVEGLPDQMTADETDVTPGYMGEEQYEKYVKVRDTENYVLHGRYKNNNSVKTNDLQKEGVPPFSSDDSDSENGHSRGKLYKITPHKIRHKWVYFWFKFASFFGDEEFYLTCLPFLLWNVDTYLMRQTVIVWSISMYIGSVMKDIFQWQRPATPPVVRLDVDFAQEFSLPSTHAVAASSIPFTMAIVIVDRYQVPAEVAFGVATVWCLMTCGSRLYLGVHSLLDVVCGCLISLMVAMVILPFRIQIDWFIQTSPASPIVLLALCLAFSTILYPAPEIGNNTRGDALFI
ncbi:SGPP2-like protein [Mya arenaria]|uniref:SGPP2-like protein n=1 Tax=Mya arenaria TaxID=6604 RepID=A0ABY7D9Y7_MYAAR|nr:SGPP2-like protein [Mya arenaria]